MGRAEAFAQSNPPVMALWDGITSGAGYMAVLLIIAAFREILGAGSLMGYQILGEGFTTWTIMVMPPSAFFLLGSLIWAAKTIMIKKEAS
jgi:Na+-transporting NADH:ubiquinone oxidoreductase subunit D